MSRPQSNGLVELVDEKQDMDSSSWNCMDFWNYNYNEADRSWETSHARFLAAKSGNCPYKEICPRYAKTMAKQKKIPYQTKLF